MIKLKKYVHYRSRSKGREYHYIMTHGLYHVQPFQLSLIDKGKNCMKYLNMYLQ